MFMRIFIALMCMLGGIAVAQVCATPSRDSAITSIAGIINSCYPSTAGAVPVNSSAIPIGPIAAGNITPIAAGDLVIVMQMQGAEINTTNSDCYGDGAGTAGCATRTTTSASYASGNLTTNYMAGNWEYCVATSAAGASLGVACAGSTGGTVNAYLNAAPSASAGSYTYQIIRVPQYASTALTGALTPSPWNGSSGGVLALQASGTVTGGV
jgi:hypothetical protein